MFHSGLKAVPLASTFGSFRHTESEYGEGHGRGGFGGEKRGAVSEMIDDHAGSQPAERSADPLGGGDGAQSKIVAAGAAHDVGDHQRCQGAEDPGADAIEQLDADQPEAVVGEGVEHRADRQDGEPGEKLGLASPTVGRTSD